MPRALLPGRERRGQRVSSPAEPGGRSLSSSTPGSWGGFSEAKNLLNQGRPLPGSPEKMRRLPLAPAQPRVPAGVAASRRIFDVGVLTLPWAGKEILGDGGVPPRAFCERRAGTTLLLRAKVSRRAVGVVGLCRSSRAVPRCGAALRRFIRSEGFLGGSPMSRS